MCITMKITYIKLVNVIGIYAGTGLHELEIDFSKSKNKITMLLGGNGKGKTSLLSYLNPYRESFDARKNLIILDENDKPLNGLKEIHYEVDGKAVTIQHYYSKTSSKNKSFVQIDGVEQNENGNIKSAYQVIEKVLRVSKDYFTVGRLGDNVSNFINFKTAKRKEYINTFVPSISPYLEAYDITNTKFRTIKHMLDSLNSQLTKFGEVDLLEENKSLLSDELKKTEDHLTDLQVSIAKKKEELEQKSSDLYSSDLVSSLGIDSVSISSPTEFMRRLVLVKNDYETAYKTSKSHIDSFTDKYSNLSGMTTDQLNAYMEQNKVAIAKIDTKYETLGNQKEDLSTRLLKIDNSIQSTQSKISNLKTYKTDQLTSDLANLDESIDAEKKSIDSITSSLGEDTMSKVLGQPVLDIPVAALNNYQSAWSSLKDIWSELDGYTSQDNLTDILNLDSSDILGDYAAKVTKATNELNAKIAQHHQLAADLENLMSSPDLQTAVATHSSKCSLGDDCPFMKIVLSSKNSSSWSTMEDLSGMITKLEEYISSTRQSLEATNDYVNNISTLWRSIHHTLKSSPDFKAILPDLADMTDTNDILKYFLTTTSTKYELDYKLTDILDGAIKFSYSTSNLKSYLASRDSLAQSLEAAKQTDKLVSEYKSTIKEYSHNKDEITTELAKITTSLTDLDSKKKQATQENSLLSQYISYQDEFSKHKQDLQDINDLLKTNNDLLATIANITSDINKLSTDTESTKVKISQFKSNQEDLIKKLAIIDDTRTQLETINSVFSYFSLIQKATDPKKGIPLIFSNIYLQSITDSANELLNIAYNGSFSIDIQLTQKDFFVHVYKDDGTYLTDILEASQGEQALTNLSLSLALLYKVSSGYNILYLDEVDGVLSTENRSKFLQMLDSQIENLDIDQTFIISHNNSFDSNNVDLILLDEHGVNLDDKEFMMGKNVVFDIDEYRKEIANK